MDQHDIDIRNETYRLFMELGRAPELSEVASAMRTPAGTIQESWRRLHEGHALVLNPNGNIHMANPFSAVPTTHRVEANSRQWFANCAWDAFGICAALHSDGRIVTTCPDCGDPVELWVRNERPDDESLLFHCLLPAAKWWDDIGFT